MISHGFRPRCFNRSMASLENFRVVVFRAVAEQLSFRKAAEELYLTQPAVSLQIKALEEELGVQVFDCSGLQITLTPAGKVLLQYAKQVNSLFVQVERDIVALTGDHAGQLALGPPQPSLSMCCRVFWASSARSIPVFIRH